MTKPVLYNYWRSSCSWRVRIVLEWKGIEYEYKPIHLVKDGGEHFQEEFTKLNPNQRLPAVVLDGRVLSQSGAIIEYIEETHPDRPLLPKDPFARAQVRSVCLLIGADIQPVQNLAVMNKFVEALPDSEKAAKKIEWAKFWVKRGFVALEQLLATTAGKYCVGDEVTMADLYLEPQVYNAHRFSVDMAPFPTIVRIAASLAELPEFQAAHPSKMPDAQ